MKRSWLNWKTLVVVAVGLVILGPLIRGLISIGRSQLGAVQTASPAPAETRAPASAVPTPTGRPARANAGKTTTVNVEGRNIPSESLPTVILNPGLVMPGTKVGVLGFGFDPGGVVDVLLKKSSADSGTAVSMVKVDERGAFSATFTVPERLGTRSPTVLARERGSNKLAQARATVPAGMASAKLGKQVGKPGDIISVSASGFEPDENVKVYWGQLTGDPATTLHADGGGNVGQASLQIPVGAVGNSNIVLVGSRSQAIAIAQFIMLGLYPTVKVQPYAVKAANRIGLSAKGFGPGERVLVYVNALDGPPLMTVQADEQGAFSGAGFVVPFGLKRQQSLILIGEQSRAVVNSGFIVLPYTPTTQPSTYGGFPGTTLSFYASGFAPNEVVLVYKNRTLDGHGQLISAFRVDDRGRAAAAGQYRIPSEDQGKVTFTTVGRQSQGVATATVTVQHSDVPVEIPAQPKYTLPPDLQEPTPSARPSASPSSGPPVGTEASPSSGPPVGTEASPSSGPPVGTEAPTPSPAASGP